MSDANSFDIFARSIESKTDEIKSSVDTFTSQVLRHQKSAGISFTAIERKISQLCDMLTSSDIPGWTRRILAHGKQIVDASHTPNLPEALQCYCQAVCELKSHKWEFSAELSSSVDFDKLFQDAVDSSSIPELFNKLIDLLEQCIASNSLDSKRLDKAIRRVIATLKANRESCYGSAYLTRDFLKAVLQKWVLAELEKIPAVGGLLTAIRETVSQLDEEVTSLPGLVEPKMLESINEQFPALPSPEEDCSSSNKLIADGELEEE